MINKYIVLTTVLFFIANILVWYQLNSQFVWDFWKDKAVLSSLIFSIPVALLFWYGTKNIYEASDALWPSRFLAFSSGMIVFTTLTWIHLNESPFTLKTTLCIILACMIIGIQVFMK